MDDEPGIKFYVPDRVPCKTHGLSPFFQIQIEGGGDESYFCVACLLEALRCNFTTFTKADLVESKEDD